MGVVISINNLVKKFGNLTAVDDISFDVNQGEIFALLGPNGAGKTTTLEIVEGLQDATAGKISILGFDPQHEPLEVKRRIGIQLQASAYYEFLNLDELIDLFSSFYNKEVNVHELLKIVGLEAKHKSYITQLSGGQKQRFSIIAALVNDPQIVFLDEPTTGLDPQARRNLWEVIEGIKHRGKTVILTTHYMDEAQVLADHIAIMDKGKIIARGTPKELISRLPYPFRVEITANKCLEEIAGVEFKMLANEYDEDAKNYRCSLGIKDVSQTLPLLLEAFQRNNIVFEDLGVIPGNLEDVFLSLTGKELRD